MAYETILEQIIQNITSGYSPAISKVTKSTKYYGHYGGYIPHYHYGYYGHYGYYHGHGHGYIHAGRTVMTPHGIYHRGVTVHAY